MTEDKKPKFFYGYAIVTAAFTIIVVGMGAFYSFGVFFEPVLVEFGWARAMTSGSFSLSLILVALLGMGAGKLNDRFGPRRLVTASSFVLGLGYLLMSQISDIWQLYLFYGVIISIGFTANFIPLVSTTARWFTKRRSMMTGIILAGIGAGALVIPLFTNWLISSYGWRIAFTGMGILLFLLTISAAQVLRRDPQSKGLLPDGKVELKQESASLGVTGFSLREATRTGQFWALWAAFFCLGFSIYTITVHIIIHATGLGIPVNNAVNVLAIMGGANIAGRIVIGSAADKIGNKKTLITGFIVLSATLLWLPFAKELWMLYLFSSIFGFGWATFVLESPIIAELFGLSSHGLLFGFTDAGATIGGAIGAVLIGYLFDITGNYQLGFLILGVASLTGLIFTLLLKPTTREKGSL